MKPAAPFSLDPVQPALAEAVRLGIAIFVVPQTSTLIWKVYAGSVLHPRGWINVEYLLLLSLALLFPSWWMVVLLTAQLTVSLVEPIAVLYYYSPVDIAFSLQYLFLIPLPRLVGYALLLLAYVFTCAAILRLVLGRQRRPMAARWSALVVFFVVLCAAMDIASGRFHYQAFLRMFEVTSLAAKANAAPPFVVQAPVLSLTRGVFSGIALPPDSAVHVLPSALEQAIREIDPGTHPDIVLVLSESWGLAKDDRLNQAQLQPYHSPSIEQNYRVQTGTVPFFGATTSGETRELCGDSRGRAGRSPLAVSFDACQPMRLRRAGYHTLAVHGFSPGMFRREPWYRQFGFQESSFLPQLTHDGARLCDGAFPGACDADVAAWIGSRLLAPRDQSAMFIHWVTLNAHLPVPPATPALSRACTAVALDQDASLCGWFSRVLLVQQSVARLAVAPGLRPTVFILVGDHAPPFLRPEARDRFSQTQVPFVILLPKRPSGNAEQQK